MKGSLHETESSLGVLSATKLAYSDFATLRGSGLGGPRLTLVLEDRRGLYLRFLVGACFNAFNFTDKVDCESPTCLAALVRVAPAAMSFFASSTASDLFIGGLPRFAGLAGAACSFCSSVLRYAVARAVAARCVPGCSAQYRISCNGANQVGRDSDISRTWRPRSQASIYALSSRISNRRLATIHRHPLQVPQKFLA